ncbi:MAG TPA: hypothetical protein VL173_08565 [Vicinamibacterales bacterium]|nr:hypothetical protein [Vicinamibacterales bacterium]
MRTRLILLTATAAALVVFPALPHASVSAQTRADKQTDLDAFMKQVLSRRDDNWKKLQQYTLDEDETFQASALNGRKVWGFEHEYTWFLTDDGVFVRSPTRADGVEVSEEDRRKAESNWIKREEGRRKSREKRAEEREKQSTEVHADSDAPPSIDDLVKAGNEPRFVDSAYFMNFKFDQGSYAFVGREKLLGRDVYKIEYYPHQFFKDPPKNKRPAAATDGDPKNRKKNDAGDRIDEKMDKVSMITLWIEPIEHQILQYEFTNIDFDFLPARALVRLDDMRASMRMREAFPNVWLPDTIGMRFGLTSAVGELDARYDVRYHNYKLAEVKARLR